MEFITIALPFALLEFGHEAYFAVESTIVFNIAIRTLTKAKAKEFGAHLKMTGAGCNLGSILLLPPLLGAIFGLRPLGVSIIGMTSAAACYFLYGLADSLSAIWVAQIAGFGTLMTLVG